MGHQRIREPNFFLVGASRAGTTSLWQYLIEHPDIFMPTRAMAEKEPSHFCEITPKWAMAYRDRDRYLRLFADAGDCQAVGEGSTPYLVAPEVPERIRACSSTRVQALLHPARPDCRALLSRSSATRARRVNARTDKVAPEMPSILRSSWWPSASVAPLN